MLVLRTALTKRTGQMVHNVASRSDLMSPMDGQVPTGHGVLLDTSTILEVCILRLAKPNVAIALEYSNVMLVERL
jgi:hypothetical protein